MALAVLYVSLSTRGTRDISEENITRAVAERSISRGGGVTRVISDARNVTSPPASSIKDTNITNISNLTSPETVLTSSQIKVASSSSNESENFLVPNIVHYVWYNFGDERFNMTLLQYLSVLSVSKFIHPDHIYFHADIPPDGLYWDLVRKLPNFELLYRNKTLQNTKYSSTASNMGRLEVLNEIGGIYLDTDILVLRSFDDLRKYEMTLGLEAKGGICNGIIVARKGAPAIRRWMTSYEEDFRVTQRTYNSIVVRWVRPLIFKGPQTWNFFVSFLL